jgi:hypothetical protein
VALVVAVGLMKACRPSRCDLGIALAVAVVPERAGDRHHFARHGVRMVTKRWYDACGGRDLGNVRICTDKTGA